MLRPSQKAPAAPANAPLGMAWAAKESPRTTTKKPTTPATTATTVAAAHALAMNPENMTPYRLRSRRPAMSVIPLPT